MFEGNVCNMCGRELDFFDRQQEFVIHKHIGYGSIYDGDVVDIHLCCECFDKIVAECEISPIKEADL